MHPTSCAGSDLGHTQDPQDVAEEAADLVRQKAQLDRQYETIGQRRNEIRERMLHLARTHGRVDQHGHRTYVLPEPIEVDGELKRGIKCRRSAHHYWDEELAHEIAERGGFLDEVTVTETITRIDQDKYLTMHEKGRVTADELNALIKTTYRDSLWGT